MTIEKLIEGTKLTITLLGRLDTTTAPKLETELKQSISGVEELVLDFAQLEYLSSAGLRVLLSAQKVMNRQGSMVVRNVNETVMDTRARRVLDAMAMFSVARVKAGFKTMEIMHSTFEDEQPRIDLSYLFSIAKYHDKWKDDDYKVKNNLGNKEHDYGGFYITGNSTTIEPMEPTPYNFDLYEPLDPVAEESLYELLDFLEKKEVEVLFVDTPQLKDDKEIGRGNTLYKILDEKGIDYVHFLNTDPTSDALHIIDFDYSHDFYDSPHVNYYGAEKFTDYFAEYLNDNYDLPDRRDEDEVAKDWDGKYDAVVKKIKADEKKKNEK